MVNKKVVIIASIIAILIVGGIICFKIMSKPDIKPTFSVVVENKIQEENKIEEKKIDENAQENEENAENSENVENTQIAETTENNTETNPEEFAKNLAKKKWNENDDTVYYRVEEKKSEDVYIISVRDKESTIEKIYYAVNIKTQAVDVEDY